MPSSLAITEWLKSIEQGLYLPLLPLAAVDEISAYVPKILIFFKNRRVRLVFSGVNDSDRG